MRKDTRLEKNIIQVCVSRNKNEMKVQWFKVRSKTDQEPA